MKILQALIVASALVWPSAGQNIIPAPGASDRPPIDVESYEIRASIEPETGELSAVVEIRFVQLDRDSYAVFDLDRRLRVDIVYLGETDPVAVRYRQFDIDSTLEVDLSELDQFEQPVLRIEYAGRLPAGSVDPAGTRTGIDSLSAFLLEEGKWYPMNGVRSDAARMRMELSVPAGWDVVSPLPELPVPVGRSAVDFPAGDVAAGPASIAGPAAVELDRPVLVREPETGPLDPAPSPPADSPDAGGVLESEPDRDNPVAEFFAAQMPVNGNPQFFLGSDRPGLWGTVIAGPFNRVAPPFVDGTVEVLVRDELRTVASRLGETAADMFRFYSDIFGPAVSPTLRIIEVDLEDWEGQSAPGVLLLPSSAFVEDPDLWDLAQRVAEQWFPLKYAVADPVRDAWIAEGMGVFASLHYFRETLPSADAEEYIRRTLIKALSYEGHVRLREAGSLPLGSAEYRSVAGYKGGFVFRMLSELMGPDLFGAFLREFRTTFEETPVTTDRLMDLASDVNGRDLAYFFDQWLNFAEVPEFRVDYRTLRMSAGGFKVEGQVTQDLDLFSMPVEIEVLTDGEPEYATVFIAGPSSDIDIFTERKPTGIVIDPGMKLLRISPDIRVAVHISRGEDLTDAGEWNAAIDEYQAAIDLNRLSSLAFFRMGEALFELNSLSTAADMFRESINGDLDPAWVEVWAYINIGKIYDLRVQRERALIEYQKAVNTGDDAYGAQAEAQRYIERPFQSSR